MIYHEISDKYRFIPEKAENAGFRLENGVYTCEKDLENRDFFAAFSVLPEGLSVTVREYPDGLKYIPFNVKHAEGPFVTEIRREVGVALRDLLEACFESTDMKNRLMERISKRFGTVPEEPWEDSPGFFTFKTAKKQKWYALFMPVPYRSLKIDRDGKIDVVNLKLPPERVREVVDGVRYLPAYHMNKTHWITALLGANCDIGEVESLIAESYDTVENKK
ncbi:MAG: MmcQ/YjbR family DNA-binding protein [Clostridia bacterium]|nr:MmcQ/YjbR family DNA-binding protein [Clostridia bacterium]